MQLGHKTIEVALEIVRPAAIYTTRY